ncbi:hypothetical protein B7463_g583, partial [Scytalidium lignicola]
MLLHKLSLTDIHDFDGTPSGPFTTVAHVLEAIDEYDDFALDKDGNAFLTTGAGNSIELITVNGERQKIIAGNVNSTAIAESTSAAFGRHPSDQNVLYVTTAGGSVTPVDGDIIIGGQLIAITTPFQGVQNPLQRSGPFEDARDAWLDTLKGDEVPTKPIEEIVTISPEDGQFWDGYVCVSPNWPEAYVSPPCIFYCWTPTVFCIEDDKELDTGEHHFLRIHRTCLSFLYRINGLTPRELWESLYQPGSHYSKYGENGSGLLYCVEYYDMQDRDGQEFNYAIERSEPPKDRPDLPQLAWWWDPESMEDTK